jgi:DNA-3-methyladenine glycosylase II
MTYKDPTFESLVRSIVYQQLSGKAAATIFGRLATATGEPITPEAILRLRPAKLRTLGLSQQKTTYIRDLAAKTAAAEIDFVGLRRMQDVRIIETLTRVKGVGVWTAHMFLIFALRRPNVLPTGDLGIRNAIRRAYGLEQMPTAQQVEEIASGWHPYCSVASWYLWRSLELEP